MEFSSVLGTLTKWEEIYQIRVYFYFVWSLQVSAWTNIMLLFQLRPIHTESRTIFSQFLLCSIPSTFQSQSSGFSPLWHTNPVDMSETSAQRLSFSPQGLINTVWLFSNGATDTGSTDLYPGWICLNLLLLGKLRSRLSLFFLFS